MKLIRDPAPSRRVFHHPLPSMLRPSFSFDKRFIHELPRAAAAAQTPCRNSRVLSVHDAAHVQVRAQTERLLPAASNVEGMQPFLLMVPAAPHARLCAVSAEVDL